MKRCSKCKLEKKYIEFHKHKGKKDGYSAICILCQQIVSKECYERHKEKYKFNSKNRSKVKRREFRKLIWKYLEQHPCVDCSCDNPICLDFDHITGLKKENISRMVTGAYSWETILEEIKKCEVRCANCHRIKTAKQFKSSA